ncbi:MAG: MraY family glycosyltransferase [Patescibacteria group bacterium]
MSNLIPISWSDFLPPFLWAVGLSLTLTGAVKWVATKFRIYGPTTQHHDERLIPRLGGIAIYITFLATFLWFVDLTPPRLGFLLGMSIIFLMGLLDDLRSMPAPIKLLWQVTAIIIAVSFGVHIGQITNPLGGVIILSPLFDYGLSVLWLMVVTNALNILDGLDGLAAGVTSIFSVILFILSLFIIVNQPATATMAVILLGSAVGFLWWNWHPAKIFMGDSGSNMLGFMMGALAIISGAKIATAALVLGFPIFDLLWAGWRRWRQGRSPLAADREHLHHRLLDAGVSHRNVVLIILSIAGVFGAVSLLSGTWAKILALFGGALLMIMLIRTVFFIQRRKSS